MKKRRVSHEILFSKREKKFLRNARNPRKYKLLDEKNKIEHAMKNSWSFASTVPRKFSRKVFKVNFCDRMDIFSNDFRWAKIFNQLAFPVDGSIFINMKKARFIYPEFLVYLASVSEHLLAKSNVSIQSQTNGSHDLDKEFDEYLNACGLRDFFHVKGKEDQNKDPIFFGDCVPISRDDEDKSSLAHKLSELLDPYLKELEGFSTTFFAESLAEIMGNSLDHAEVPAWFRIGQVHEDRRMVTIAIADNGVGIPHTLKNGYCGEKLLDLTDSQILKESCRAHVTRYEPTKEEAHGQGLNIVYENTKSLKGKLALLSGRGLYRKDFTSGSESLKDFSFDLPGTLLVLRVAY